MNTFVLYCGVNICARVFVIPLGMVINITNKEEMARLSPLEASNLPNGAHKRRRPEIIVTLSLEKCGSSQNS